MNVIHGVFKRNPDTAADVRRRNAPLVNYALRGLDRCWLPEEGRWSHIYHLDGRDQPNESVPASDVFYTLNVLLGLSRVPAVPDHIDLAATYERNALALTQLPVAIYAYGMALWAAAELDLPVPAPVRQHIERLLADERNWRGFRAQDIGMLLTGAVAQASAGGWEWFRLADHLFDVVKTRYRGPRGLFHDAPGGLRRRFSSFATQTYLTLACYRYGEFVGDAAALDMANTCARRLIALQGPQGEWPWFFDTPRGAPVDFYEVYSVHQYGMAPAFLECAERHGVHEARSALITGFKWVLGDNQLGEPMLRPDLCLSIRSQVREGELTTKLPRMLRAVTNACLQRDAALIDPSQVTLRRECRSYELGWILWSFGRRPDLAQLTHHALFAEAVGQP